MFLNLQPSVEKAGHSDVSTALGFKKNAIVYATGSTLPQNRLYKSCISKYVDEIKKELAVFTLEAVDHVEAGGAAIQSVTLTK
jgi:hypothetical protein